MKTRKRVTMTVTVSLPRNRSAAWARREVKSLIKDGVGWETNAGDDDGVKAIAVRAARKS